MIKRADIAEIVSKYRKKDIRIGSIASHSGLDVADGAVEEGFRTILYCQKGREQTYKRYFKSKRVKGRVVRGMVDDCVIYDKFSSVLEKKEQEKMRRNNVIFIPNRALTSYASIDAIENEFMVPLFGSRNLLRTEERGEQKDYYWLLEKAGLRFPEKIKDPKKIGELAIVKLHHAKKKLERGFFTAASHEEYMEKSKELIKQGVITQELLDTARIERYIIGPVFNLDFFYSPLEEEMEKIELLGIDWRFETSLDGHVRLPAAQQMTLKGSQRLPEYTVCGHNSSTVRESLLEEAFKLAEKYVKAAKQHYKPGIIGPFCLQTCIDKDNKFYIYDVAPRVGGGTNVHMAVGHPYANSLWRSHVSTGRRIAMEIRRAAKEERLGEIVT